MNNTIQAPKAPVLPMNRAKALFERNKTHHNALICQWYGINGNTTQFEMLLYTWITFGENSVTEVAKKLKCSEIKVATSLNKNLFEIADGRIIAVAA